MHILFSLALLLFLPQTDSPSNKVFLNDEVVDLKKGISLSDYPNRKDELNLSFVFDKGNEDQTGDLGFKMELAVVRSAAVEMRRHFANVYENQKLNVPGLLTMLKPGDDIVIDLSNSVDAKRVFFTIRVRK